MWLTKDGKTYRGFIDGKIECITLDKGSALQALWRLLGEPKEYILEADDDLMVRKVYKEQLMKAGE